MRAAPVSRQALHALRVAAIESERTAAVIRVAIFLAMLVAVVTAQSAGFDHGPLVAATAAYGAVTLAGLVLAGFRVFRTWLAFVFVALDVATLALAILLLGRMLELTLELAVTLPVGGLVILVLLHASMHYRPALVLFGAGVFVATLLLGTMLVPAPRFASHAHLAAGDHLAHFRLFPATIFALATGILVVTTRRTRRYIDEAYAHASRAATLSRYFAPEIAEELTARSGDAASFGDRMSVGVIFADLRGFTAMAEAMDPAELAHFLSEYRSRIAAPALEFGGVVDKYIGDAIMVVFGAPNARSDDAVRTLRCASKMLEVMRAWSHERERTGAAPLAVGIGAHFGRAFAGVLSDGRLLEYTVIGDTVNVASRLADIAGDERSELVVSGDLAAAAGGLPDAQRWTMLPAQALPGHPRRMTLHRRA